MKLREYIENLNEFAKENPETLDMVVVYAKDSEGNGFESIYYTPNKGYFDQSENDFVDVANYEDRELDENDTNAVCIN
jgi:hypothetical protein